MRHLAFALLSPVFAAAVLLSPFAASAKKKAKGPEPVKTALNSPHDVRCQATYSRIYSKPVANVRVVFGYKDTRPGRFVGDRHERIAFVQSLLEPCRTGWHACGFARAADNADLFTKTIKGPGGKPVKIKLLVANSSVGSDDEANREDPFQEWQSDYASSAFHYGLEKADMVFYNGHSRMGGGPDFRSPRLSQAGKVDAKSYKHDRPGFETLMESIRKRGRSSSPEDRLRVLGLFSCASAQHFTDDIALSSEAAIISSNALLYYADALGNSQAALSGLLEMRCQDDLKKIIHSDSEQQGSQLKHFY